MDWIKYFIIDVNSEKKSEGKALLINNLKQGFSSNEQYILLYYIDGVINGPAICVDLQGNTYNYLESYIQDIRYKNMYRWYRSSGKLNGIICYSTSNSNGIDYDIYLIEAGKIYAISRFLHTSDRYLRHGLKIGWHENGSTQLVESYYRGDQKGIIYKWSETGELDFMSYQR